MIRHTQQLGKEYVGMIARDLTIIHFIGEQQAALVVVRSGHYSDAIDIFQTKQYRLIIVYIRSFFIGLYGIARSLFLKQINPAWSESISEALLWCCMVSRYPSFLARSRSISM